MVFHQWTEPLSDSSLVAIAAQIVEKAPKIKAVSPNPLASRYADFSLPLRSGRNTQDALLVEVFEREGEGGGFNVSISDRSPLKTQQRLQAEGRVLSLPE